MITFNGKRFAKTVSEFNSTLFDTSGTASGFYRVTTKGVMLLDLQKQPMAFILRDAGTAFIVSASKHNGRTWYSFSTTAPTERYLGIRDMTCSEVRHLCHNTLCQVSM
jgi:hypothetical protein